MMTSPSSQGNTRLKEIAGSLDKDQNASPTATVRELLGWFGAQRRGWRVVATVRAALRRTGLSTEPDFATAYIDGPLTFALKSSDQGTTAASTSDDMAGGESGDEDGTATTSPRPSETIIEDPVLRVRMLPAANRQPVTVTRDDPVTKAVTLMATHDYSQLPVTQNMRDVDGMISWRSIQLAQINGTSPEHVRDCTERHEVVGADDSLLRAFQKIVDHEVVLVRGTDKLISGIVTSTDLSVSFRKQTEPFLLLSEIEIQLRRLLNEHFAPDEPRSCTAA